jgi:hypothetical protein
MRPENPFASPLHGGKDAIAEPPAIRNARAMRSARLPLETDLKQNVLALLGVFVVMSAVCATMICSPESEAYDDVGIGLGAVMGVCTWLLLTILWSVRRMSAWTRRPLMIVAFVGVLLFPIGTAFAVNILRLLAKGPAPRLLSREYEQVVRQTPELNVRTSFLSWVGLILLCVLALAMYFVSQMPPELRRPR